MTKTVRCAVAALAGLLAGCLADYQDQYKLRPGGRFRPVYVEDTRRQCSDGVDNDRNGSADCADTSCLVFAICHPDTSDPRAENTLARCSDKIDNDANGKADCDDAQCLGFQYCHPDTTDPDAENTLPRCQDKLDNDGNGAADCADPQCKVFQMCAPKAGTPAENTSALCTDKVDNDGNGKTDCADGGCKDFVQCAAVITACKDTTAAPELKFGITIYDHPPGPEFQPACTNPGGCPDGVIKGMVQSRLDAEGRPVFRPIEYAKLDTFDIINWNPAGNPAAYTGCPGCGWWNQGIANWWRPGPGVVVTKDSLIFKHIGNHVYQYLNRQFFPVGQGNYGFAVHMQRKFRYVAAGTRTQIFSFAGDDDAWVFLNGNLVLDMGGIHNPRFEFFVLGDEAERYGIREGDEVTIDFFLAERMPSGTQAIISTSVPCRDP